MYDEYEVYGPYERPDGRKHVVLYKDGERKTVSYPKYIVEKALNRRLNDKEIVHHRDGNKTNNELSNLEVRLRGEHSSKHANKLKPKRFTCPMCGDSFSLSGSDLYNAKYNRERGKAGPFCSIECAGRYSALVGHGEREKLDVEEIETEYTGGYAN